MLATLVRFNNACCRLSYGGGHTGRILAKLSIKPLVINVGYRGQQIPTIHPQPLAIPMDLMATEGGVALHRSG
ncbi:5-formyltetrahydrofolate cyclo-ligase [Geminicoccus roseus]|uniref:hypothetical protein n=1 Tax=Geminicoccus roseus TaxID=404900 RepID=UPI00146FA3D1|nr:hypothetical protein [Geminicoccus roseus]